jgi:Protein required for attachment to host cells
MSRFEPPGRFRKISMKDKLLIVTNLGLLRAYRFGLTPQHTPRVEPLEEVVMEEAHHRLDEMVTDTAGRRTALTLKGQGAPPVTDNHFLKLESRRRLIKKIAGNIRRLIQSDGHDGCWLAAPGHINHRLLEELPQSVSVRIEKNIPRDLVKAGEKKLIGQFLKSMAPALAQR